MCTCLSCCSRGYDTHMGESDGAGDAKYSSSDTDEDEPLPRKRRNKTHPHAEDMRKPVLVDSKGIPYGTMKKVLEQEVKLLAKDLDPRYSWEGQPQHAKDRFFKRVYAGTSSQLPFRSFMLLESSTMSLQTSVMQQLTCVDLIEWEIKGKGNGKKIDEMWFQKIVTKVLINLRFRLGQLIDSKAPKPPEVSNECWNDLVKWRDSELSKKKSAQMRSISRRRASKASQMQGLREAALVRLVSTPSRLYFYALSHMLFWMFVSTHVLSEMLKLTSNPTMCNVLSVAEHTASKRAL